jgi:uroporphyrinogen-III synthase
MPPGAISKAQALVRVRQRPVTTLARPKPWASRGRAAAGPGRPLRRQARTEARGPPHPDPPLPEALRAALLQAEAGCRRCYIPRADHAGRAAARGPELAGYRAVMFVSGNAVRGLLAAPDLPDLLAQASCPGPEPVGPGPGTARCWSRRACGLRHRRPARRCAAVRVRSAVAVVAAGPPRRPRADRARRQPPQHHRQPGLGREWLASQLRSLGAQVELVGVYSRQCPAATPALQEAWRPTAPPAACGCSAARKLLPTCSSCAPHRTGAQRALATHPHRRHGTRRGLWRCFGM